ncbi:acylneuraminate cytidylyltransferase family protein [Polaribacter sp.]|nr:acylneuraminate cytidylyltransferase family protein [Polaribacter sp.]
MKRVVALLPMKGTSERVPNKNLKFFSGKPLYHIILNTLLKSKYINEIVVNTDSELLKSDILTNFKERVIVIDRDEAIRGNYVSMNKVIEQDLNKTPSEIYIQTHSTNPLLKVESIDSALEKMFSILDNNTDQDSVFSVSKIQKRFYNEDGTPMNHDPKMLVTQHLVPIFEENSCFYIFTKDSFQKTNSRIGAQPFMYEINKIESSDIDEPDDFIIAEALHSLLR